jgi:hypothetical protein
VALVKEFIIGVKKNLKLPAKKLLIFWLVCVFKLMVSYWLAIEAAH